MRAIDLTGQRFGRLVALEPTEKRCGHSIVWKCLCDCGNICHIGSAMLKNGNTKSCGCLHREGLVERSTKHGMAKTKIYWIWADMIGRCKNLRHHAYKNYGGRGLVVCDEWFNFKNFFADMGDKPTPGLTLERIDNDKGYSLTNCKWATRKEQKANQRDSIKQHWFFAYNENSGGWDEDNNQHDFAKRHNIYPSGISKCLLNKQKQTKGWTFEYVEV